MARRPTKNHLSTIEYIGPRPQSKKPVKRPNFLGGWVVLLIAAGAAYHFGLPLVGLVKAQQVPASQKAAVELIRSLEATNEFGSKLAAEALKQTTNGVTYDSSYYKIPYPNGDIPFGKGKAEDVVVRAYRPLGIDLQQKVHEDMTADFTAYSGLLETNAPDASNDHRRAVNLERFFERHGQKLGKNRVGSEYTPGDVVIWSRPDAPAVNNQIARHIGIVVPNPNGNVNEPWVVDHLDSTVKWENKLFSYPIQDHYRYTGADQAKDASQTAR